MLRPCEDDPRVLTEDDVVRASFVAVYPKRLPRRIVLRHQPGIPQPWVVHEETLDVSRRPEDETKSIAFRHRSFEDGDYFSDEKKARDRFEERAAKL